MVDVDELTLGQLKAIQSLFLQEKQNEDFLL